MFKRIYSNGISSLVGVKAEWVRPNTAKAKYLEIPVSELEIIPAESDKAKTTRFKMPVLFVVKERTVANGRSYLVVFHPKTGIGMSVVEPSASENIFGIFDPTAVLSKDCELPWFCRIYELETSFKAISE